MNLRESYFQSSGRTKSEESRPESGNSVLFRLHGLDWDVRLNLEYMNKPLLSVHGRTVSNGVT